MPRPTLFTPITSLERKADSCKVFPNALQTKNTQNNMAQTQTLEQSPPQKAPAAPAPKPTPPPAKPHSTTSRKKITVRILNTALLLLVLGGLYWVISRYYSFGNDRYTNSAQIESYINPVNTRVSAYIKEIRFVEHQAVKAGDTLLILDDREIQTQVGQAEAAYQAALAGKRATQTSVRTATNNIATSQSSALASKANIATVEARFRNTEQNYRRYQNLLKDEAVTGQQFDQVKAEYEAGKAQLEAAKAQYAAAQNTSNSSSLSVNEVSARLGLNDAEIMRAGNALDMARLNLSYTVITAPHGGIMGRRAVNVGQLLSPGQQVATLVDISNIWVSANYREKQMNNVHIGGKATLKVDALAGKTFEGTVTSVSGATGAKYAAIPVDNATGNFVKVQQRIPVRIEFTGSNRAEDLKLLRAGMNVEVTLE